jgi:D-glycero-D-manno-heptose 1,7-bisphosphate phosphatase
MKQEHLSPPPTPSARPALILDRDGVINEDTGYVHRADQCRFVDGIFDLAGAFAARGFAIIIATNQSGIGRGLYTEQDFAAFMAWMTAEFARRGVTVAGVYHCPDHPTAGIGAYRRESSWRKPAPGMLLQAARDHGLDLARSWTVGDKPRDIEAGRAAQVGTLVLYDPAAPALGREADYWIVPRLADIGALLVRAAVRQEERT